MANISAHLVQHFDELRSFLPQGCTRADLVGVPDDQLVPDLEKRLRHRAQARVELRQEAARERAGCAATRLSETSSRRGEVFMLDVPTLLGDLLADRRIKNVSFELGADVRVTIPLRTLAGVRQVLGKRHDLVAFVDEHGLHFRWKGGRGGLRFYSQQPAESWSPSLIVELLRPALPPPIVPNTKAPSALPLVEALTNEPSPKPPALAQRKAPARSARPSRRNGSWLHDILSNLGF